MPISAWSIARRRAGRIWRCLWVSAWRLYTPSNPRFSFLPRCSAMFWPIIARSCANAECGLPWLLLALLLAPLAVYTLTVGQANLQQSFGSDKTYVMEFSGSSGQVVLGGMALLSSARCRSLLNSLWLVLGAGSVLYGIVKRDFLRKYALWFGWLGSWYFLFSYFLNKQDRYAIFWLPAWIVLAVGLLLELNKTYSWRQGTVYLILAIPCLASAAKVRVPVIDGFDGVDGMVKEVIARRSEGNILYVGERHQIVVPFVRMYDSSRSIQVLRGSDLLGPADNAADVCRDYRVRFIVAERDEKPEREGFGGGANFLIN